MKLLLLPSYALFILDSVLFYQFAQKNGFVEKWAPFCVISKFEKIKSGLCMFAVQKGQQSADHLR